MSKFIMSPSSNEPEWLRLLKRHMLLKNFKPKTMKTYIYALHRFHKATGIDPLKASLDDILEYQLMVIEENVVSFSTYRVNCCALRFFYDEVCPQEWSVEKIPFPKKETRLPVVMSLREAMSVIMFVNVFIVRAALQLIFSTGMRLSEARNLKWSHIDHDRNCIRVVRGKGGVDREIPFKITVSKLFEAIRQKTLNPKSEYVFASSRSGGPIDTSYFNKELKAGLKRSPVNKEVTAHSFRHTFATLQLQNGMNIRQLQKILGHKSIHTTLRYIHLIEESWTDFHCLLQMGRQLWKEDQEKNDDSNNKGGNNA